MHPSSRDFPDIELTRAAADEPPFIPPSARPARRQERRRKYVVLFLLTLLTTTVVGAFRYYEFSLGGGTQPPVAWSFEFLLSGLWYSVGVLAILGAHEMGHYLACRYYGVDASLPYFLPLPPPFFTGTLGAFIRIRQPIRTKRELFDIGIAGPIAGFLVAVPVMFMGVRMSGLTTLPENFEGTVIEFGEPLVYQLAERLTFGAVPEGQFVNLHPLGFAAWFGLLATALNLFPVGQLDGGHISYAVLGRKSTVITLATVACLVALTFLSQSWVVWTVLTIGMLFTFGPHHPRTIDEHVPLDPGRTLLAAFALLMFILCFTPAPMEIRHLVGAG
jgi:membrane-associated protease RseP (regulator of RpoE activity)